MANYRLRTETYPLNLANAIVGERWTEDTCPSDYQEGLDYVLSMCEKKEREMLSLRFHYGLSYREIGEEFDLKARSASENVERILRKLRHPDYSRYILFGYAEGMRRNNALQERKRQQETERLEALGEFELMRNDVPLHKISDMHKRIDAILIRSNLDLLANNLFPYHDIARRLKRNVSYCIWHLCFYTEAEIFELADGDLKALEKVKSVLAQYGLELDDGMLSDNQEAEEYAEVRANELESLMKKKPHEPQRTKRKYRHGILVFDAASQRMDIRFDLDHYCGGLHCGQCFEVYVNGQWTPTRIEMADDWYLVDIPTKDLVGLRVRIPM